MTFASALLIAAGEPSPIGKPLYLPVTGTPDLLLPTRTLSSAEYLAFLPILPRDESALSVRVDALLSGENGMMVPLTVTRKVGVNEVPVAAGPLVVGTGDDLRLQLRATLPAPGNYDLFMRLRTPQGSPIATIGGKVIWAATALPSDGIIADPPVTLFSGAGSKIVDLPLTGIAEHDVSFTISPVKLFRTTPAGKVGIGATSAASSGCQKNLPRHKALPRSSAALLQLRFCNVNAAGEYHAQFDLIGDSGGIRHVDVAIKNRLSWAYFLLAISAGGIIGAPLAWWRAAGREQADTLLTLTNIFSSVQGMGKQLGSTRAQLLQPLVDRINQAKKDVAERGKYDGVADFLSDFGERRNLLGEVVWQLGRARQSSAGKGTEPAAQLALEAIAEKTIAEATAAVQALELAVTTDATAATIRAHMIARASEQPAPIEPPAIHPFTGKETYSVLLRKRNWFDIGNTFALFLLFVILALQLLWTPNAVWGSFTDFAIALTTGVAAFGGLATQLGTFKTTVRASST